MAVLSWLESLRASSTESDCTPARVCAELADIFCVRTTEVGLLRLDGQILIFLFPVELLAAGSIPLSSSAIAARTAASRTGELFNNFANVRHRNVFERIKLAGESGINSQVIQKLMSAPILGADQTVLGVIQISRKGVSPAAAGPDFNNHDLRKLEVVASEIGKLMLRIEKYATVRGHKLKFHT